jgi:hypothetical protein
VLGVGIPLLITVITKDKQKQLVGPTAESLIIHAPISRGLHSTNTTSPGPTSMLLCLMRPAMPAGQSGQNSLGSRMVLHEQFRTRGPLHTVESGEGAVAINTSKRRIFRALFDRGLSSGANVQPNDREHPQLDFPVAIPPLLCVEGYL